MKQKQQAVAVVGEPSGGVLGEAELEELAWAAERLNHGAGLVVRLADMMGGALGRTIRAGVRGLGLAPGLQDGMRALAAASLRRAFDVAVIGLPQAPGRGRAAMSQAVVMASGAAGGFAGIAGFVPDATLTTLTIMREIARAAQREGESLIDPDTRRACLEVFALGGTRESGGEGEIGYLSTRFFLQGQTLAALIGEVAGRYGVALSQKFGLQAVPVLGAIGGAALNAAFLVHYRGLARAHFTVRRLERRYGRTAVAVALGHGQ